MGKVTRKRSRNACYPVLWILYSRWPSSVSDFDNIRHCHWYHHTSALVSPWMENGDALTYVKKNKYVDYKQLVRSFSLSSGANPDNATTDLRHCAGDRSPSFYGPTYYPWKFESCSCPLFLTNPSSTKPFTRKMYLLETKANRWSRTLRLPRHVASILQSYVSLNLSIIIL